MTTAAITAPKVRRFFKPKDPLLTRHKLTLTDKIQKAGWSAALSQIAVPIGSAIYFLVTQAKYQVTVASSTGTFWLKDTWDRLPVHIQNALHARYLGGIHQAFGLHSQAAPLWWVTARHDARHVLIGFLAALLIGTVLVGVRYAYKLKWHQMIGRVVLAFLASAAVTALMVVLLSHGLAFAEHWGTASGNPWVSDWVNKGSWQLTAIGVIAAIPAHRILMPVFATFQNMSADKRIARSAPPPRWYPPNYRHRYEYLKDVYSDEQEAALKSAGQSRVMGLVVSLAAPVLLGLFGFGVWVLYFSGIIHH